LPLQEESLGKLTFATDLERSEVLVPRAGGRFGLGLPPQLELVEILGGYSAFGNSIEEMLT
jgi:hypothetical protein